MHVSTVFTFTNFWRHLAHFFIESTILNNMNNYPLVSIHESGIESDDFAIVTMLSRIENGDEVDNEDFSLFVKKSHELIRNLNRMVLFTSSNNCG
jgi:hypothetical protein